MKKLLPNKGFTLIELLVAISILAILAVIGVSIFAGAQRNARDGKRKTDVDQMARAIETGKDPAGAAGTYAYTQADFTADFPGGVKESTSGNVYCLHNTSAQADPAAWTTTCPVPYATFIATDGTTVTTAISTAAGWKICASLEGGTRYCKTSLR